MLIDWFTVGAQILNFLILVWLLQHFLYHPIIAAIDNREKRIAADIADATARKIAAQKEGDELAAKNQAFDTQRAALLAKACADAKVEGARQLADARKAADGERLRQTAALHDDLDRLGDEIGQTTKVEVFAIARRALADLADVALEERIAASFEKRLHALDGKEKDLFSGALTAATEPAVVRSAFVLPEASKAAIRKALDECCTAPVPVRFETAPDAVCGIEVTVSGQKFAWSIAEYLKLLQGKVGALLDAQAGTLRKEASKPPAVTPAAAPAGPPAAAPAAPAAPADTHAHAGAG
jgi:F-type H+-transporting ATPase subunit b